MCKVYHHPLDEDDGFIPTMTPFDPDPLGWLQVMSLDIPCLQSLCLWCAGGLQQVSHPNTWPLAITGPLLPIIAG